MGTDRKRTIVGPGTLVALVAIGVMTAGSGAVAQAPAPQPPATAQTPPAAELPGTAQPGAAAGEIYSYRPEGRRDPFVSLLTRGVEPGPDARTLTGIAAMTTAEISVRGVLQSQDEFVAMIQGPDAKTYIVHPNDRLLDGVITRITPQGLIILQEVNDPLSLVKQREVQKNLRAAEDTP